MGAVFQYSGGPFAQVGVSIARMILESSMAASKAKADAIGSAAKSIGVGIASGMKSYSENRKERKREESISNEQARIDEARHRADVEVPGSPAETNLRDMAALGSLGGSMLYSAERDRQTTLRSASLMENTTPIDLSDSDGFYRKSERGFMSGFMSMFGGE